jgi:hypothetical protein
MAAEGFDSVQQVTAGAAQAMLEAVQQPLDALTGQHLQHLFGAGQFYPSTPQTPCAVSFRRRPT